MIGKFTEWVNTNNILDEANFTVDVNKTKATDHHSPTYFEITYLDKIKKTLLDGKPIFLDVPKNITINDVTTEKYDYLTIKDFKAKDLEKAKTYTDFCNSLNMKSQKVRALHLNQSNFVSHIWKGSFSNRGNSSSKGGVFEVLLTRALEQYQQDPKKVEARYKTAIEKILKIIGLKDKSKFKKWDVKNNGNNRSKRLNSLCVNLESISDITKLEFEEEEHNIGKTVSDLIITAPNGTEFYLSLKHGSTNEIVNFGAAKIRKSLEQLYNDYVAKGEKPNSINSLASTFLKNYCKVFNLNLAKLLASYDLVSNDKEPQLKTFDKLKNTKCSNSGVISEQLSKLIAYCIGYGYIYVHDTDKEIEVIDIMENEDLAEMIRKYSGNYNVKYACDTGAKTVFDFVLCDKKDKKDIFIPQSRIELRPNAGAEINLFSLKLNINASEMGNNG